MTLISKFSVAALIVGIGVVPLPSAAEDYQICLTDERSNWPIGQMPRGGFRNFYVISEPEDEGRLEQSIIDALKLEGLNVSSGSYSQMSSDADIVITYETNWVWDMRDKLPASVIFFRDASTNTVLVVGNQTGLAGLASKPTVPIASMVNRLASDDLRTPLCWSTPTDE